MGFLSVLSFAHKLTAERLAAGGRAIDATVGTGADTLFLAKAAGPRGGYTASTSSTRRWLLPESACGWPGRQRRPRSLP